MIKNIKIINKINNKMEVTFMHNLMKLFLISVVALMTVAIFAMLGYGLDFSQRNFVSVLIFSIITGGVFTLIVSLVKFFSSNTESKQY